MEDKLSSQLIRKEDPAARCSMKGYTFVSNPRIYNDDCHGTSEMIRLMPQYGIVLLCMNKGAYNVGSETDQSPWYADWSIDSHMARFQLRVSLGGGIFHRAAGLQHTKGCFYISQLHLGRKYIVQSVLHDKPYR